MQEKHIISGEKVNRTIFSSLGQVVYMLLQVKEDEILQVDTETGDTLNADELRTKSICVAKWLQSKGLKPNDVISINSENCLEYGIVAVGALFSGTCCAPLNPDYTGDELKHVINLSKPKVLFCSSRTVGKMIEIADSHSFVEHIILFGSKTQVQNNRYVTLFENIVCIPEQDNTFMVTDVDPNETLATILCSSGTTGLPKGVMTTHSNIISFIEIMKNIYDVTDEEQQKITMCLTPFFHSLGYMQLLLNIIAGRQVIILRRFRPQLFLESIVKHKISTIVVPPPIVLFLTKHPLVRDYDISCLKEVKCGAAPMGKIMELEAERTFQIDISQGYGMTETTLAVLTTRANVKKAGSVGQIVPGMMCKVIDEQGNSLGPNQEGELCFKGPLIMLGYVGDRQATENVIDKDRWLHTGDVGYYDEDCFFFIVDRIKELIKYKAYQVAPAELEALLLTHPAILDAAVVGLPDEEAGELPLAYVVRKPGKQIVVSEVQEFVASKVSSQKRLRGGVQFVNEIPKNPSGKILRRVLKQRAKQLQSKL